MCEAKVKQIDWLNFANQLKFGLYIGARISFLKNALKKEWDKKARLWVKIENQSVLIIISLFYSLFF